MKRIFSSPFIALAAGLVLRLFFVLKFPANSGDTILYQQIATNWLRHHLYAMEVHGAITPVDLRMPGYPAYLVLVYWVTGRSGDAAHLFVLLGQVAVDLVGCVFVAALAVLLNNREARPRRVLAAAWWLAMLCPFTANYDAAALTEAFAIALTAIALVLLAGLSISARELVYPIKHRPWEWPIGTGLWAAAAGFAVGLGTLFRPEAPLLLLAGWLVTALQLLGSGHARVWIRTVMISGVACIVPLAPWAVRNALTLDEVQFLAPKDSSLPGELVPKGFMAWERTWLYRVQDCYLVPWKLNEESIDVDAIPARAFDSAEEKHRVAEILERYNDDLTLNAEQDAAFGQIARERSASHPLRTYLWIPVARAAVIWFSPRIELLPISGHVFPLAYQHEEDPVDQEFTSLLFVLNLLYVGLGIFGAVRLWRANSSAQPVILFFAVFLLLRTIFLTTLETPEPRYVLVCFPILIALGAQSFGKQIESNSAANRVSQATG